MVEPFHGVFGGLLRVDSFRNRFLAGFRDVLELIGSHCRARQVQVSKAIERDGG